MTMGWQTDDRNFARRRFEPESVLAGAGREPGERKGPQSLRRDRRRGDEPGPQVDRAPPAHVGPQHRAEGERVVRDERPAVNDLDPDGGHVPVGRAKQMRAGFRPGQRPGVNPADQQELVGGGQPGCPPDLFDLDLQAVGPARSVQGRELVGGRAGGPGRVPADPQVRRPLVRRGCGHQSQKCEPAFEVEQVRVARLRLGGPRQFA